MKIVTRLILHNICKPRNIEATLAIAAAFRIDEVIFCGRRKTDAATAEAAAAAGTGDEEYPLSRKKPLSSSSPHSFSMRYFRFFKSELVPYLKSLGDNHLLVGIEIDSAAVPATELREKVLSTFRQRNEQQATVSSSSSNQPGDEEVVHHVTFIAGSEGEGLHQIERDIVDIFVYVAQYEIFSRSGGGAGSLNVCTAQSVVLSEFFYPTSPISSSSSSSGGTERSRSIFSPSISAALRRDNFVLIPSVFYAAGAMKQPVRNSGDGNDDDDDDDESSSSQQQQHHHDSGYVHFLMRPASSFGAHTLAVIVSGAAAAGAAAVSSGKIRVSHNRSKFGTLMRAEKHCELDTFSSVMQFVRDLRQKEDEDAEAEDDLTTTTTATKQKKKKKKKKKRVFVIGIVSDDTSSSSFDMRSSQLADLASYSSSSNNNDNSSATETGDFNGLVLSIIFGKPVGPNGELCLTPSERTHCNLIVNYASLRGLNIACAVSIVLHSLCHRLAADGLVKAAEIGGGIILHPSSSSPSSSGAAAAGSVEKNDNKFAVAPKRAGTSASGNGNGDAGGNAVASAAAAGGASSDDEVRVKAIRDAQEEEERRRNAAVAARRAQMKAMQRDDELGNLFVIG